MNKLVIAYTEWKETADTLRLLLQIIGKIKAEHNIKCPDKVPPRLYLTLNGFTTGIIPSGETPFEITVDLREHFIQMCNDSGKRIRIRLQNGVSIARYFRQINHALVYIDAPTIIPTHPLGFPGAPNHDADEEHHSFDASSAILFQNNLLFAYRQLKTFTACPQGKVDFPAYYWETMDVSAIVYNNETAPFHADPHVPFPASHKRNCRFGFRPGDASMPDPSFFVIPYPFLSSIGEYGNMIRPDKAIFCSDKRGFFLKLKEVFLHDQPEAVVTEFFESSRAIAQFLKHR